MSQNAVRCMACGTVWTEDEYGLDTPLPGSPCPEEACVGYDDWDAIPLLVSVTRKFVTV